MPLFMSVRNNLALRSLLFLTFLGKQLDTQKQIAIKMIKVGEFKDGLDMSAIREIKFLQEIRHPNVIELIDVFSTQSNLNIVLEFLPADLEMIIKDRSIIFTPADIKSWLLMTLRGLHHCHRNFVLHRVCFCFFHVCFFTNFQGFETQ